MEAQDGLVPLAVGGMVLSVYVESIIPCVP